MSPDRLDSEDCMSTKKKGAGQPSAGLRSPRPSPAAFPDGLTRFRKRPVVIDAFRMGIDPRPDWFTEKVTRKEITT